MLDTVKDRTNSIIMLSGLSMELVNMARHYINTVKVGYFNLTAMYSYRSHRQYPDKPVSLITGDNILVKQ